MLFGIKLWCVLCGSKQNYLCLSLTLLGSVRLDGGPLVHSVNRPAVIKLLHANPAQHSLYVQVLQGSDA